eukprot:3867678-Amphidinium_carterae.2
MCFVNLDALLEDTYPATKDAPTRAFQKHCGSEVEAPPQLFYWLAAEQHPTPIETDLANFMRFVSVLVVVYVTGGLGTPWWGLQRWWLALLGFLAGERQLCFARDKDADWLMFENGEAERLLQLKGTIFSEQAMSLQHVMRIRTTEILDSLHELFKAFV